MSNATTFERNESERILALKRYEILDTPPDSSFDHVVQLASQLFDVPVALVSMVDTGRIWFKSSVGIEVKQIDREAGLCASAILSEELYIVENAATDPRTIANPLVVESGYCFYAAVPLKIREGYNIGTLCVIDKKPRSLTDGEKSILKNLGAILVQQLEQRLEARQTNEKQNRMLGIIAHELKNCLTTIPVYAGLIQQNSSGNTENIKLADNILRASGRMKTVIQEMLEMSMLQASEMQLKKKDFDIASIVGRVAASNLVLATAKRQKLFLDITDNVVINADESKIAEIADNLINNAIKYSPPGGRIIVKVKAAGDKAILEVLDEGPGFTKDDEEKLFLPFTKLSARPTAGEHSTGMGLSIVKMLVEAHGGLVIGSNNKERTGALFIVELPAAEK